MGVGSDTYVSLRYTARVQQEKLFYKYSGERDRLCHAIRDRSFGVGYEYLQDITALFK
ncbi:hypothetical protein [Nostoc sp.]|uniref:hypothetical protein n=1 Tax=Nostoc sp. TaxID=1180 RepID=UPI002FFB4055